jgi:hypothetical protein
MIAKSDAASIFRDTRGSRSIEISVPGAFTAVGFSGKQKNPGASAAERGRPSLFKTIDEDRRERHDYINRSGRSTYPGRNSVLTSGATPKSAFAIRSFTFVAQRKNPFDVNRDFVQPFERLVEAVGAANGNVTVKGQALDNEPLTDIVRSAAATGDSAKARVQLEQGQPTVNRNLRGDPATISADDLDSVETRESALTAMRTEHRRIRYADETN